MSPVTQATGSPTSSTRASIRCASCGLVAKGVSGASPTACRRAGSSVQAAGRYSSRSSSVWPQGPDVGQEHPHLAVANLAQRAAVLPRHPGRMGALLGKARLVDHDYPLGILQVLGDKGVQLVPRLHSADQTARPSRCWKP